MLLYRPQHLVLPCMCRDKVDNKWTASLMSWMHRAKPQQAGLRRTQGFIRFHGSLVVFLEGRGSFTHINRDRHQRSVAAPTEPSAGPRSDCSVCSRYTWLSARWEASFQSSVVGCIKLVKWEGLVFCTILFYFLDFKLSTFGFGAVCQTKRSSEGLTVGSGKQSWDTSHCFPQISG